jgi:hypothetical protein
MSLVHIGVGAGRAGAVAVKGGAAVGVDALDPAAAVVAADVVTGIETPVPEPDVEVEQAASDTPAMSNAAAVARLRRTMRALSHDNVTKRCWR